MFLSYDYQFIVFAYYNSFNYMYWYIKSFSTLTYCILCFICYVSIGDLRKKDISSWTYFLFCDFRLVMSDLAFYSGTFKTLRGLESLAQDTNDVWDIR